MSATVDLSKAEPVAWTIEGQEGKTRVRLADGSVLEFRVSISNVMRTGNEPNTGLPAYVVAFQSSYSLVNYDKKERKQALSQPGPEKGSPAAGFA